MTKVSVKDITERVFWSFILGALTNLAGVTVLGVAVWKAAVLAGLSAVTAAVIAIARWRLSVLPDPGAAVAEHARAQTLAEVNALTPTTPVTEGQAS